MRRIPRYMRCVSMCVRMCLGHPSIHIFTKWNVLNKKRHFQTPLRNGEEKKNNFFFSCVFFFGSFWFWCFYSLLSLSLSRAALTTFIISFVTFSISTISRLPHTSFACCLACSDFHRTCFHSTRAAPALSLPTLWLRVCVFNVHSCAHTVTISSGL